MTSWRALISYPTLSCVLPVFEGELFPKVNLSVFSVFIFYLFSHSSCSILSVKINGVVSDFLTGLCWWKFSSDTVLSILALLTLHDNSVKNILESSVLGLRKWNSNFISFNLLMVTEEITIKSWIWTQIRWTRMSITYKWINKMYYIHIMKYYSAIKHYEVPINAIYPC